LVILSLGAGYNVLIRSLLTSMVERHNIGTLYPIKARIFVASVKRVPMKNFIPSQLLSPLYVRSVHKVHRSTLETSTTTCTCLATSRYTSWAPLSTEVLGMQMVLAPRSTSHAGAPLTGSSVSGASQLSSSACPVAALFAGPSGTLLINPEEPSQSLEVEDMPWLEKPERADLGRKRAVFQLLNNVRKDEKG
ncbi:MAG: hypothetical protein M1818_002885, partial [Claussenomyces sp. TS43310]